MYRFMVLGMLFPNFFGVVFFTVAADIGILVDFAPAPADDVGIEAEAFGIHTVCYGLIPRIACAEVLGCCFSALAVCRISCHTGLAAGLKPSLYFRQRPQAGKVAVIETACE